MVLVADARQPQGVDWPLGRECEGQRMGGDRLVGIDGSAQAGGDKTAAFVNIGRATGAMAGSTLNPFNASHSSSEFGLLEVSVATSYADQPAIMDDDIGAGAPAARDLSRAHGGREDHANRKRP